MWNAVAGSETDTIQAEYDVGRNIAAVIKQQMPCDTDADSQVFLDEIGHQLAQSVRNKLHRFHVTAVVENRPTAFALPGGFIFVTRSLMDLCNRNRNEMAFVLAHEMAHVIRRHAINRILRQTTLSAATLASPGGGMLSAWIRKVGLQWLERAHSQEQEFEADALGALLMRAAGFDPAGAVSLLKRLRGLDQTPDHVGLDSYLSTHPTVDDRILNLHRRFAITD